MSVKKYADYYISTKKTKHGYVWYVRNWVGGEYKILESSLDFDDKEDQYYETKRLAEQQAKENIQDYFE